jgi:hypothetical protein
MNKPVPDTRSHRATAVPHRRSRTRIALLALRATRRTTSTAMLAALAGIVHAGLTPADGDGCPADQVALITRTSH